MFFKEGKVVGTMEIFDAPQSLKGVKQNVLFVVKLNKIQVSQTRIAEEVIYGDLSQNPLEHMASLAQRVYHPIVESKGSGQLWSETIAKGVRLVQIFDSSSIYFCAYVILMLINFIS